MKITWPPLLDEVIPTLLRRFDDAHLWSGLPRGAAGVPTVAVIVKPRYWSLPLSLTFEGHVLGCFGITLGFGPLYVSWCYL